MPDRGPPPVSGSQSQRRSTDEHHGQSYLPGGGWPGGRRGQPVRHRAATARVVLAIAARSGRPRGVHDAGPVDPALCAYRVAVPPPSDGCVNVTTWRFFACSSTVCEPRHRVTCSSPTVRSRSISITCGRSLALPLALSPRRGPFAASGALRSAAICVDGGLKIGNTANRHGAGYSGFL